MLLFWNIAVSLARTVCDVSTNWYITFTVMILQQLLTLDDRN